MYSQGNVDKVNSKYLNKRAFLDMAITIPVFLFLIAMVMTVMVYVSISYWNAQNDTTIRGMFFTTATNTIYTLDKMIPLLVGGFGLIMLVICSLLDTHPIFYIISIMLVITSIGLAAIFSNTFSSFLTSAPFQNDTNTTSTMTTTGFVMNNYVLIILGIAIITGLALAIKIKSPSQEV